MPTNFWEDALALSPDVAWEGDEASGATAADDSGNGYDGTYFGSVLTQGNPSLVPNLPDSACWTGDGTDAFVYRLDGAGMDVVSKDFTCICTIEPTDLSGQRDLIGKQGAFQVWIQTTGRLTIYVEPSSISVSSSNDTAGKMVAGQADLIAIRQRSSDDTASIWLRGVKVGEVSKATAIPNTTGQLRMGGSSVGANRSLKGSAQCFLYWNNYALTDAEMLALYTKWATVATPVAPDTPDIDAPLEDEAYNNSMEVTLSDVSGTGAYGTLEYEVEYNLDGGGWTTLIDWTETRPDAQLVDLSALASGSLALRAYARRSVSEVSAASATTTVTLDHSLVAISTPTVTWDGDASGVGGTGQLLHKGAAYLHATAPVTTDPAPVTTAEWQVDTYGNDFATPITYEITDLNRLNVLFTGQYADSESGWDTDYALDADTDYEARLRYSDDYGGVGAWSAAVRFRTALGEDNVDAPPTYLVSAGATDMLYAKDESGNAQHLVYALSASTAGVPNLLAAHVPMTRFPYHKIAGGADDYGVVHDNLGMVTWGSDNGLGGQGPEYSFPATGGGKWPAFRIRLRGYLLSNTSAVGFGILGIDDGATGANSLQIQQRANGELQVTWRGNSSNVFTYRVATGAAFAVGEEFDFEIESDGAGTMTVNGNSFWTGVNPTLSASIIKGTFGHHTRVGPALASTFDCLAGILLELEFEWDGTVEIHCNLADPEVPNTPVVSKTEP